MVEHSPKILVSEEKAATVIIIISPQGGLPSGVPQYQKWALPSGHLPHADLSVPGIGGGKWTPCALVKMQNHHQRFSPGINQIIYFKHQIH